MCDRVMRLKREVPFRVGGLPIDLTRKFTVVLSINRHVEEGYFLVCFPFNGELDLWFNVV